MPNKKGKRKQKQKNNSKKVAPKPSKAMVRAIMSAPVNYGDELDVGQYLRFRTSKEGNPVIAFRTKIANVQAHYNGVVTSPTIEMVLVRGGNVKGSYFLGGNSLYVPDPLFSIVKVFNEMKYLRACFTFIPRIEGGTQTAENLVLAFSSDPTYGQSHDFSFTNTTNNSGYTPTEEELNCMEKAKQFTVWKPITCMDVTSMLDKKWNYVNGPDYNSTYQESDSSADQRQSYAGVLFASGTNNFRTIVEAQDVEYGSMYLAGEIELRQLSPAGNQSVTMLRREIARLEEIIATKVRREELRQRALILERERLRDDSKDSKRVQGPRSLSRERTSL